MRATGIVRRVDDLGRVVIPKEIRRQLKIEEGAPLEFFVDAKCKNIILQPYRIPEYTLQTADMWQRIVDKDGNVLCEGHNLSAEDVLNAMGIAFEREEIDDSEEIM